MIACFSWAPIFFFHISVEKTCWKVLQIFGVDFTWLNTGAKTQCQKQVWWCQIYGAIVCMSFLFILYQHFGTAFFSHDSERRRKKYSLSSIFLFFLFPMKGFVLVCIYRQVLCLPNRPTTPIKWHCVSVQFANGIKC